MKGAESSLAKAARLLEDGPAKEAAVQDLTKGKSPSPTAKSSSGSPPTNPSMAGSSSKNEDDLAANSDDEMRLDKVERAAKQKVAANRKKRWIEEARKEPRLGGGPTPAVAPTSFPIL